MAFEGLATAGARVSGPEPERGVVPPEVAARPGPLGRAALEHFFERGYARVPGVLSGDELDELRGQTARVIERGFAGRHPEDDFQHEVDAETGQDVFYRVLFASDKPDLGEAALVAAAHPAVTELAAQLLGPDFVGTISELLFKLPHCGRELALHRDTTPEERLHPDHLYVIVALYLDRATVDTGCLRVLPGTQHDRDVSAHLTRPWDDPALVPVEAAPGDLIVHDARVVHGSPVNRSPHLRRSFYFEFHAAHWVLREGIRPEVPVTADYVARRMRLQQEAVRIRRRAPYARLQPPTYAVPASWSERLPAEPDWRASVPCPPFF